MTRFKAIAALIIAVLLLPGIPHRVCADRSMHSLNGTWQFRPEGSEQHWKHVELPASFETHQGVQFNGVGIYRKIIPPFNLPAESRLILHFQAVATLAEVSLNGHVLGKHLGGWTPFRFDVTHLVRAAPASQPLELQVRVDEKVGHNSQGFLPVFAPHFGGIWQEVYLMVVSDSWIDDLTLLAIGHPASGSLELKISFNGSRPLKGSQLGLRYRLVGEQLWGARHRFDLPSGNHPESGGPGERMTIDTDRHHVVLHVPVDHWKWWSPNDPNLYEVEIRIQLARHSNATVNDCVVARAAFRTIETCGHRLLLNGKPIIVRGLLNWGYAPPLVSPSISEPHMRKELQLARSYGFNLMKFCLWVPPKRYLDIADEIGMLTWMEYPTWHSKWSLDQLPILEREFAEFFHFDRNHPSVILRSLTCETGPSADLTVIRKLYDQCHAAIPGSVVEDDSSWIAWNRVHDFYDDHPYGNNHTWVKTLDRLKQHIADRDTKPLILGEAIAADTWVSGRDLLDTVKERRPFWLPMFLDGNRKWKARVERTPGASGLDKLAEESRQYALLMRKFQIETYRREVPSGGYVVSVIRDFPKASMGMLDYLERPKWSPAQWQWHAETMVLLQTEADRRSFAGGDRLTAKLAISHFGQESLTDAIVTVTLETDSRQLLYETTREPIFVPTGGLHPIEPISIVLPEVKEPMRTVLTVAVGDSNQTYTNRWPLWIVPAGSETRRPKEPPENNLPDSLGPPVVPLMKGGHVAEGGFRTVPNVRLHGKTSPATQRLFRQTSSSVDDEHLIAVAETFDDALFEYITDGGRVLLLPNGAKGSFPLAPHWFLRGGPYVADHPLMNSIPRQLIVELQHFDLAGSVIPNISYFEQTDPVVLLWDNHDIDSVHTHGLVFEARMGKGRILVSALDHSAQTNAAGRWLAGEFVKHLAFGAAPVNRLPDTMVESMRTSIGSEQIDLIGGTWRFKPDPDNIGLEHGWHTADRDLDESWKPIRIGTAWESVGYPELDGWAWYRIAVDVPIVWKDRPVYISFQGVDDYYDLYVNGEHAGSGGDIKNRKTAFEERKSHRITKLIQPGDTAEIAIRVFDWQGAGGLFRPISVGTAPFGTGVEVLK